MVVKKNKNLPLVSTITPVLNGQSYIAEHLESIKKQTYSNIEMIVVDNFSTDSTLQIAKKYGAKIYRKGPERAAQDNYGVKKAHGKYVFITGCDMVLDHDYIEKCVHCCEDDGYDAVYASVKSRTQGYWSKVKAMEREAYIGDNLIESARFYRRDIFLALGGFDTNMVLHADDYDMQRKLNDRGYKTGRVDACETHIDEIDSITEMMKKSFYYGMHSVGYLKKYGLSAAKQLAPIRGAYFRKANIFLPHPFLTVGLIALKFVQYLTASIGLTLGLLKIGSLSRTFHRSIYKELKSSNRKFDRL